MKVLAVGDIHTKTWILNSVAKLIDDYDAIVFVGDYADDWGASPVLSIETWRSLKVLQALYPNKVHIVSGNHDYIYAYKTATKQSGYNYVTQTLIDSPENKGLKEWLRDLPIMVKLDGVTYSHAGVTKYWHKAYALDKGYGFTGSSLWVDGSPMWARPYTDDYLDIPQVFGHTPSETCWEVKPNVWCIDTFSTYPDGESVGDQTVLKITDGKKFKKVKINNDDNSITSIKAGVS